MQINRKSSSDNISGYPVIKAITYCGPVVAVLIFVIASLIDAVGTATDLLINNPFDSLIYTIKKFYWGFLNKMARDPYFYIGVPLIFFLQVLKPVRSQQSLFGVSTRTDLFFTLGMILFSVTIAPVFYEFLQFIYDNAFGFLNLDLQIDLPTWMQLLLGYLIIDFLGWLHHLVRHKVPAFWEFHAVHHSQTEMNPFTNERVHPFDWFVANTIKFIPAFMFTNSLQIILQYIVIHSFLDHLNHANVKTNYGWFRFILVTPQSHRVHHSSDRKHYDSNYGVSTSIWDHLFCTQCRDYGVYPETGIPDKDYPLENDQSLKGIALSVGKQMVYPFIRVWRNTWNLARQG